MRMPNALRLFSHVTMLISNSDGKAKAYQK
jgi:hypothetical protein